MALGVTQEGKASASTGNLGLPDLSTNPRDFGLSIHHRARLLSARRRKNNPQHGVPTSIRLLDNLTYAHGRHLMKFGVEFRTLQQNAFRDVQSRGFINFLGFTGNPLSELAAGLPGVSGGAHLDNPQHLRTQSYNFFAQDSFRIRPNLTLSWACGMNTTRPRWMRRTARTFTIRRRQALVAVGKNGFPRSGYLRPTATISLRAWASPGRRARGKRPCCARDTDSTTINRRSRREKDFTSARPTSISSCTFPLGPTSPLLLNDPFPSIFPLPTPSSALAFQRDLRTPYICSTGISTSSSSIGTDRVARVGYVGSKGTRLIGARDINQPLHASAAQFNPRPVQQFDDIDLWNRTADSIYTACRPGCSSDIAPGCRCWIVYVVEIDRRCFRILLQRRRSEFSAGQLQLRAERGRSNFDLRHRLSVSYAYDLPWRRAIACWVAGRPSGFSRSKRDVRIPKVCQPPSRRWPFATGRS